jgi:hypothetical protein
VASYRLNFTFTSNTTGVYQLKIKSGKSVDSINTKFHSSSEINVPFVIATVKLCCKRPVPDLHAEDSNKCVCVFLGGGGLRAV